MKKNWQTVGLISLSGSIFFLLFIILFTGESSILFYLKLFLMSFFVILVGIGIIVALHTFFNKKMETSKDQKDYSLDSGEESGKRQRGSDEDT